MGLWQYNRSKNGGAVRRTQIEKTKERGGVSMEVNGRAEQCDVAKDSDTTEIQAQETRIEDDISLVELLETKGS